MRFGELQIGKTFVVVTERKTELEHTPVPVFVKTNLIEIIGKEPRKVNALYLNAVGFIWFPEEMEVLPIAFPNGTIIVDIKSYTKEKLLELHRIIGEGLSAG